MALPDYPEQKDIKEILFPGEKVQQRVKELADLIVQDYKGRQLHFIITLKGADFFAHDLLRNVGPRIPVITDYMLISTYGDALESSGKIKIPKLDLGEDITNKDVLLIEDIVDTGFTFNYLCEFLKSKNPKTLKTCVLLNKSSRRKREYGHLKIDYLGFDIPDRFVVGYGMDYRQYCRNWQFIAVLELEE